MEKITELIDRYVPAVAQKYGIAWAVAVAVIIIIAWYFLFGAGAQ